MVDWITRDVKRIPPIPTGTTKVKEVSPTVNSDYVEFTGLDINTDGIYIIYASIKNPLASGIHYYVFVEGDYITTNYWHQYLYVYGTSRASDRDNFPSFFWVGAGDRTYIVGYIFRDHDGYFRYISLVNRKTGSAIEQLTRTGCKTATVTNITKIRIQAASSGGIGAGSKFTLCKGWI